MRKARILIVDDAVVVRRCLADALAADPALDVVGTAANGQIALAKIPQLNPDLVILDVEMPELDGKATLLSIRKTNPALPVIMFSSLTERGAPATIELLALGASDYAAKPANFCSGEAAFQFVRESLVPKIKALCGPHEGAAASPQAPVVRAPARPPARADILAIGASTGGPHALSLLLPALPADLPVPVVVVQHMPPVFTRLLAERLDQQSAITVREAVSGELLAPGTAWIAPGDLHLVLKAQGGQMRVQTYKGPPENGCRPAVDVLFRSVAETFGARALAVVLTGMGQDGLRGCEAIRHAGGQILAQDQASSVVWGMPGQVVRAGLADRVLPLNLLPGEVAHRLRAERGLAPPAAGSPA